MTEDGRYPRWQGSLGRDAAAASPRGHVDVDTLALHAAGKLPPGRARTVRDHLRVCEDGRCVAYIRSYSQTPAPQTSGVRARTFQCRDRLWRMFVDAADGAGASIDDLVNEAMFEYSRSHGYSAAEPDADRDLAVTQEADASHYAAASRGASRASRAPATSSHAPDRAETRRPPGRSARPPRVVPRAGALAMETPHVPISPPGASIGTMSLAKRLILTYEGERYEVDKERFLIGRTKAHADLRLDDPNVSRQHAAIERIGSIYYLVDLGSTNGVYVLDDRVTRRALADGDVILITTHRIFCQLG